MLPRDMYTSVEPRACYKVVFRIVFVAEQTKLTLLVASSSVERVEMKPDVCIMNIGGNPFAYPLQLLLGLIDIMDNLPFRQPVHARPS